MPFCSQQVFNLINVVPRVSFISSLQFYTEFYRILNQASSARWIIGMQSVSVGTHTEEFMASSHLDQVVQDIIDPAEHEVPVFRILFYVNSLLYG